MDEKLGPCYCTDPDHTGKCRCQHNEEYTPPDEQRQRDMLHWYNQGYFDALMDQANEEQTSKVKEMDHE